MNRYTSLMAVAGIGLLGATSVAQPLPVPTLGEPTPVFAPADGGFQGPSLGGPALGAPAFDPSPVVTGPAPVLPGYGGGVPQGIPSEPWLAQPAPFSAAVPLYPNVRYKQTRNAHPCAAPLIVAVKDPRCGRCGPSECLYVKICVPPCDAPCRVVGNRDGSRTRYDWGKYAVTVHARRNGVVYVDYDD